MNNRKIQLSHNFELTVFDLTVSNLYKVFQV